MLGKQVQTDLTTSLWSCLDDSGVSASEALYGAHLCLSGEFLDSDRVPPAVFLERVQSALRGWCCLLIITDLPLLLEFPLLWPLQTSHLFARILKSGLCLNFTQGPYKVLTRSSMDAVSIDPLKSVHSPKPVPQQPSRQARPTPSSP